MGEKIIKEGIYDVLLEIGSGRDHADAISKGLGLPLTTTISRLKKLEQLGLVKSYKAFNKRIYELTSTGKEATTKFRDPSREDARGKVKRFFAHKVSWSMKIAREPEWLREELQKAGFITALHKNWLSLNRQFDDHTISFHKNRVFIYFTEFALDQGIVEYYPLGMEKMDKVKEYLEREFKGLKLTDPRQHGKYRIHNQHIVERFGDVAMKFQKVREETGQKVIYHGKNFDVDFSKGWPEQEFVNKTGAVADALAYAEFVDGFCEAPFQAKDVLKVKEEVAGVQDGIKAILQENKDVKEVLEGVARLQVEQGKLQAEQTNTMNVFAKAMEEHLVLVRELQNVTKTIGEGLTELRKPWLVRVFEGFKKIFHKKQKGKGWLL